MKTRLKLLFISSRLQLGFTFALGWAIMICAASVQVPVEATPLESGQATQWVVTDTTTLNAAITAANAETSGTHTITFGSAITLSAASTDINLQPSVTLIIEGGGYGLNGAAAYRGFKIIDGAVEIRNLNITNGVADDGGGIYNINGTLTVTNSTFSVNSAVTNGGGIYNEGTATLTVEKSTFSSNDAKYGGGISNIGILTVNETTFSNNDAEYGGGITNVTLLTVTNSTFSGNSAEENGGGIENIGTSTVTNSTFSGNSATYDGGGIISYYYGSLTVTNSTFRYNVADSFGGGIYNEDTSTLHLINTIMTTSYGGDDCWNDGTLGTDVHNLIRSNSGCGTPISDVSPLLGPLQDNGGPTHTMAIDHNSPAFNAGDSGFCPSTDQRGVARPNGAACDIGAYEFQIPAPVDFNFDHASDVVVFRGGAWRFFDYETAAFDHGVWTGTAAGCIPAPMDYDGDGEDEPTQLCGGAWHFYNDNGSYNKGIWTGGVTGDLPVPADYDGDGTDDIVVWRAGAWRFFDFASGVFDHGVWTGSPPHWLGGTSMPIPIDYDGDGAAEFTVWSGGPWHFYHDDGSYNKGIWTGGVAGDLPAPADYNGDITEEVVVWRSGAWRFFDFATAAFDHGVWTGAPPHWLGGTPLPSPLDYDGNGIVDFTVWSGGPWHFYDITGAYIKGIWTGGVAGDLPISRRLLP